MGAGRTPWAMRQLNATTDSPTIAITAVQIGKRAARDGQLFLANAVMFHRSHRDPVQGSSRRSWQRRSLRVQLESLSLRSLAQRRLLCCLDTGDDDQDARMASPPSGLVARWR